MCGSDERPGQLLCCESCPSIYHLDCAGLDSLPAGDWYCPQCSKALTLENVERILDVRVVGSEDVITDPAAALLTQQAEGAVGGEGGAGITAGALVRRHSRTGGAAGAGAGAATAAGPKEYYVKWKERSYLHCSWVHEGMFDRAAKLGLVYLKTRLRKFHADRDAAAAVAAAVAAEDEEEGTTRAFVDEGLIHGVHPAWLQVGGVFVAFMGERGGRCLR